MAGTANLESMEVEVPVCRFQRELEGVCVPYLTGLGERLQMAELYPTESVGLISCLFVVLEKQQKTTNKLKICTKK